MRLVYIYWVTDERMRGRCASACEDHVAGENTETTGQVENDRRSITAKHEERTACTKISWSEVSEVTDVHLQTRDVSE